MSTNQPLLKLVCQIERLFELSANTIEEPYRLTLEGSTITEAVLELLESIHELCLSNGFDEPNIYSRTETISYSDLKNGILEIGDNDWRLVLGKEKLSETLRLRSEEKTFFYFFLSQFYIWLNDIDPLEKKDSSVIDFSKPTTFFINGLKEGFGGNLLWLLPIEDKKFSEELSSKLPNSSDILQLVHNVSTKSIEISPKSFEVLYGNVAPELSSLWMAIQARVFGACLVQDIRFIGGEYIVSLNGTKRLSLPLYSKGDVITDRLVSVLSQAVEWIYSERPETRLQLVMDRLSIDIRAGQSLVAGAADSLEQALTQAKDSYAFVILERKDAYHKELRELMKDMKEQSDIYASKVRNLVSDLTRDTLGILVFIGFSFIGKFDTSKINELLTSKELSLLTKFLSVYLILSCILQLSAHIRDSKLTFTETKKWLSVLQNYTSLEDRQERFLRPIEDRRFTLIIAMWISAGFYFLLALLTWNLPKLLEVLLQQP